MLEIFEQIFGGDAKQASQYPEELIGRATERALDATDPRVRILSGYAKKMRSAIIHSIDHIVQLVDTLALPVPLAGASWAAQPITAALFASAKSLEATVARDAACRDFFEANPELSGPVTALLVAKESRKAIFGYDLVDDRMVADVPLTEVSYDEHRMICVAANKMESDRLLKLRAFDHLLVLALKRITDVQAQRHDLAMRKEILQAKLDVLARGSGAFADEPQLSEQGRLQQKMDQVESELARLPADANVLQNHLGLLVETLASAEHQLHLIEETICLDQMHYLREAGHPRAVEMKVQKLRDGTGRELVAQRVNLLPSEFSKPCY